MSRKRKQPLSFFQIGIIGLAMTTVVVVIVLILAETPNRSFTLPQAVKFWTLPATEDCPPEVVTKTNLPIISWNQWFYPQNYQFESETDSVGVAISPDHKTVAISRYQKPGKFIAFTRIDLADRKLYAIALSLLVEKPTPIVSGVVFVSHCAGKTYIDTSYVRWKGEFRP